MELPIGVFAIAVSTVVYPLLARHAVEGQVRRRWPRITARACG